MRNSNPINIILVVLFILPFVLAGCIGNANENNERQWVYITAPQCVKFPWETGWIANHPDQPYPKNQTNQIIKDYYATFGITVYDVEYVTTNLITCMACLTCPSGKGYNISVSKADAGELINQSGVYSDYSIQSE